MEKKKMKIRRFLSVFLLTLLLTGLFCVPQASAVDLPQVNAKAALLMDYESGRTLYGLNERDTEYPASITKVMTALLTLEQPNLQQEFTVDETAIRVEGSSMGLRQGDTVTLISGNDMGVLLLDYVCSHRKAQKGELPPVAVKTIVTTEMAVPICKKYGVELRRNCKVTDAEFIEGGYRLTVPGGTVETRCVINAAGIWADKVHSMVEPANFHIIPTRGEYYLLDKSEGTRVSHVIFQCPNELGKGVLVAPTVHGNLIVGPNAEPVEGNDTSCTSSGLEFVKTTAQRSVPSINFGESIRSFAGVRANLDVDDFIIGEEPEAPGWIDLAGMKSPGLSAAPAVAEEAVAILKERGVLGAEKADYKETAAKKRRITRAPPATSASRSFPQRKRQHWSRSSLPTAA